jgi:hypothetical protein
MKKTKVVIKKQKQKQPRQKQKQKALERGVQLRMFFRPRQGRRRAGFVRLSSQCFASGRLSSCTHAYVFGTCCLSQVSFSEFRKLVQECTLLQRPCTGSPTLPHRRHQPRRAISSKRAASEPTALTKRPTSPTLSSSRPTTRPPTASSIKPRRPPPPPSSHHPRRPHRRRSHRNGR